MLGACEWNQCYIENFRVSALKLYFLALALPVRNCANLSMLGNFLIFHLIICNMDIIIIMMMINNNNNSCLLRLLGLLFFINIGHKGFKISNKSFKSEYDLKQTILTSEFWRIWGWRSLSNTESMMWRNPYDENKMFMSLVQYFILAR